MIEVKNITKSFEDIKDYIVLSDCKCDFNKEVK